jgi:hypothetical protein
VAADGCVAVAADGCVAVDRWLLMWHELCGCGLMTVWLWIDDCVAVD